MAITFVTWGSPRQCGKRSRGGARLTGTQPHGTPVALWLTVGVIHTVRELFTESVDMSAAGPGRWAHRSGTAGGPERGTIIAAVLAQRRFRRRRCNRADERGTFRSPASVARGIASRWGTGPDRPAACPRKAHRAGADRAAARPRVVRRARRVR